MENPNINLNGKKRIKGHIILKFDNILIKQFQLKKYQILELKNN